MSDSNDTSIQIHFIDDRGLEHQIRKVSSLQTILCQYLLSKTTDKRVKQSHYRPEQALRIRGGWSSQTSRQSEHEGGKVVSPMHQLPLSPRKHFWYSFLLEAESTTGPCGWEIMSMKNSSDTIENRTHDLRACSTVPQPNVPSHTTKTET